MFSLVRINNCDYPTLFQKSIAFHDSKLICNFYDEFFYTGNNIAPDGNIIKIEI